MAILIATYSISKNQDEDTLIEKVNIGEFKENFSVGVQYKPVGLIGKPSFKEDP